MLLGRAEPTPHDAPVMEASDQPMDEPNETQSNAAGETAGDDLSFEVTSLAPAASHADPLAPQQASGGRWPAPSPREPLLRVTRAPLRVILTLDARALRVGLAALMLLALAAWVFVNLPGPAQGWFAYAPLATSTATANSRVVISAATFVIDPPTAAIPTATIPLQLIGAIPQNCGPAQTVPSLGEPGQGTAVGHDPVWVDAFDGPTATVSIRAHGAYAFTQYGWEVDVNLVFTNGFTAPVTLSGDDLTTNYPLWFGVNTQLTQNALNTTTPTTAFTIDARQATAYGGGLSGPTALYSVAMYLPGAGCYHLAARWPKGAWQITFAAGA